MKNISSVIGIVLLAITLNQQAQADVIVNTGAPTGNIAYSPYNLDSNDWLAAQIHLTQTEDISSILGYISDNGDASQIGNTFTVTVYNGSALPNPPGGSGLPTSEAFQEQATFTANGWNGLSGLNLVLNAGYYWVAFEVAPINESTGQPNNDTFAGLMPVYTSNPLLTASYSDLSGSAYALNYPTAKKGYDIGLEVNGTSAVPVPPSLVLFVSGLLALGRFGKRKSV